VIAFFQISLSAELLIVAGSELAILEMQTEVDGHGPVTARVYPPYRSKRVPGAPPEVGNLDEMNPADPQPSDPTTVIGESAVVRCDAIAVDLWSEKEFERTIQQPGIEPLLRTACDAANGVFERIRVLARATHLKPIRSDNVQFRLVFLTDDRDRVASEEGKFVETGNVQFRIQHVAVVPEIWQSVVELGEYGIPPWDELLLDAQDLDTELGPALVLAAAAIETRIATALDSLAAARLPTGLWRWVRERDADYTKTPSVAEQLDVLLRELGGRSLKEDQRLWEAGVHLRQARNSFVHEGRAMVGRREREPVSLERARELVHRAGEIIDFVEAQLPESDRRPRLQSIPVVTTTTTIAVSRLPTEGDG
jgi:hypothetical protein